MDRGTLDFKKIRFEIGFHAHSGVMAPQVYMLGALQAPSDHPVYIGHLGGDNASAGQGQQILYDGGRMVSWLQNKENSVAKGAVLGEVE